MSKKYFYIFFPSINTNNKRKDFLNKTMRTCLLFILLVITYNILGQTVTLSVRGTVFDIQTGQPVNNVNLIAVKNHTGTTTGKTGFFELKLHTLPDTVKLSHINYKPDYFVVKTLKDTSFTILMKNRVYTLDEINIESEKTVYNKNLEFTILDYSFVFRNIIVLQKKIGINAANSVVILNESLDTIVYCNNLPKNSIKLYKDCLSDYHVLTKDSAYQIVFYRDSLVLMKPFGINKFYKTLGDCLFRIDRNIYFKKKSLFGFSTHLYCINEKNKNRTELISSIDSTTYHQLLTDVSDISSRYWGHNMPISSIENDSLLMSNIRKYEHDYRFLKEIGDKPIENYIFHINDTVVFFDFNNLFIQLYSTRDSLSQNIKIRWGKPIINKSKVIEDAVQHNFYVVYRKSGLVYLYLVNLHQGTLKFVTKFSQMTYENIKVNNNTIYYLYNHFNNHPGIKQLYMKDINNCKPERAFSRRDF